MTEVVVDVFGTLQLKAQSEIVVLDAPRSFEPEIEKLDITVHRKVPRTPVDFALAFVTEPRQVERSATSASRLFE